jgi:imidazolonepropionase-like amidohydrolase
MGADANTFEAIDRIAALKHPLILSAALPDKPRVDDPEDAAEAEMRDLRRFVNAPTSAKKLYDAKVSFVLSTRGVRNVTDFPRNVKRMIDAGLPADAALAAVTTGPAELLGVQSLMGTVEPGKLANIIVTDGDLFGASTRVVRIFVDGYEYLGPPAPAARPAGGPQRPPTEPSSNWGVNQGGAK